MFTGLIDAVGTVSAVHRHEGGLRLVLRSPYRRLRLGESVAVDGACLSVTERRFGRFAVHVVETSLGRTRFGSYRVGQRVNLERALRVGDRLGGHLVQGHVDGVGTVVAARDREGGRLLDLAMPPEVAALTVPLGSITVDGVSLTVNALPGDRQVQVSLIPVTLQHTTLGERAPGDGVHLEADAIGKYVQALLKRGGS